MASKNTILNVMKNSSGLDCNNFIHFKDDKPSSQSDCRIITQDELDDMEIKNYNFLGHILDIAQIQDIVTNLKQRFPNPTDEQYMEAFQYYLNSDAFIVGAK